MNKSYHKGQKLYNNKPDSLCFNQWGKITKYNYEDSGCYIIWSNGAEYFYTFNTIKRYFKIPTANKQVSKRELEVTKWSFNVLSSAAIGEQEIKKNLTREHPMAIVQVSNGITLVMIHECLLEKADVVEHDTPETGLDGIYVLQTTQVSEWIKWAKAVKVASWGDDRVPAMVTVSLPTI